MFTIIDVTYLGNMSADLPLISFPIIISGNSSFVIVSMVWYSVVSIEYKLIAPSNKSSYRCCVHVGSRWSFAFSRKSKSKQNKTKQTNFQETFSEISKVGRYMHGYLR